MRIPFAPRLFAAVLVSAFLAACGGNVAGTSVTPQGNPSAQSAERATDALHPFPTPTPGPCYCPPGRDCLDIVCPQTQSTQRSVDAVKPAAATPSPTPHPPCYCPPNPRPHVCPDCAVTNLTLPGVTATEARVASTLPRTRRHPIVV